jgi:hypothetical protein
MDDPECVRQLFPQMIRLVTEILLSGTLPNPMVTYTDVFITKTVPNVLTNVLQFRELRNSSEVQLVLDLITAAMGLTESILVEGSEDLFPIFLALFDSRASFYSTNRAAFHSISGTRIKPYDDVITGFVSQYSRIFQTRYSSAGRYAFLFHILALIKQSAWSREKHMYTDLVKGFSAFLDDYFPTLKWEDAPVSM